MKMTRKPLMEMIPDILLYINSNREQLQFDLRLYRFYEGQVTQEIEQSLSREMVSAAAYNRAIQRIPSINIIKKVNDKLSKVYTEPAIRMCTNTTDVELMKSIGQRCGLESQLITANRMTNLNRRSALELYVDEDSLKVKVLAAHQFLVYSDSMINPTKPTVFIKLLPKNTKRHLITVDRNGNRVEPYEEVTIVETYGLYTDTEFMIIDSSGDVRKDLMAEMGATTTKNPFGVIPFVYINTSKLELIPYPNKTALDISILIPKLLTDLNYSAQFLSHSVIWTKNANLAGAEINPDAIVNLGDSDPANPSITPEIGTIDPKTDIPGVLQLINFQLSSYLTTEGLKAGGIGNMDANQDASGVSKIIDESDATDARKNQMEVFRQVEQDLWTKIAAMQEYVSKAGLVEEKRLFSMDFPLNMSIRFAEIRPLESEKQKYEKIKIGRDLKLLTRKQALQELYPDLTMEQLEARLQDVEDELMKEKEEMLDMGITPGFTQFQNKTTTAPNKGIKPDDDSTN
jgi:hypothetical protein